jgi:hypothetical protein
VKEKSLQKAIDRMVEESIRRILPGVLTEVLVKTVANSGLLQERGERTQRAVQTQVPGRQAPAPRKTRPTANSLRDLLEEDAGSEFYQDPRGAMHQQAQHEEEAPVERKQVAQRLQNLNPELRQLAEDIDFSDDGGEMWGDESDSMVVSPTNEIRDPNRVAASVGIDFARMAKVIGETAPKAPKATRNDALAKAEFEEQRLRRKREMLNGGKPIE